MTMHTLASTACHIMLNNFQMSLRTCSSHLEILHAVLQILMLLCLPLESDRRCHNVEELDTHLHHLGLVVDLVDCQQHNIYIPLASSAPQTRPDDPNIAPALPNFSRLPGIKFSYSNDISLLGILHAVLTDDFFSNLQTQTTLDADQKMQQCTVISPHGTLANLTSDSIPELEIFCGICLHIGIVKEPYIVTSVITGTKVVL